jgi:hypothetical protein
MKELHSDLIYHLDSAKKLAESNLKILSSRKLEMDTAIKEHTESIRLLRSEKQFVPTKIRQDRSNFAILSNSLFLDMAVIRVLIENLETAIKKLK